MIAITSALLVNHFLSDVVKHFLFFLASNVRGVARIIFVDLMGCEDYVEWQ